MVNCVCEVGYFGYLEHPMISAHKCQPCKIYQLVCFCHWDFACFASI